MIPPRTEALLFCRPTKEQCELYLKVTSGEARSSNLSDALTTLTSLRKICLHPSLHLGTDNCSPGDLARSGKLVVLDALLQQIKESAPGEKVVVVSNFTSVLSMIESMILRPRNLSYLRLDGSTDPQTRQNHVDLFNRTSAEQNFCFLLSSKAGGWYVVFPAHDSTL
jgi:SNF2 family DNA or RNA helicase